MMTFENRQQEYNVQYAWSLFPFYLDVASHVSLPLHPSHSAPLPPSPPTLPLTPTPSAPPPPPDDGSFQHFLTSSWWYINENYTLLNRNIHYSIHMALEQNMQPDAGKLTQWTTEGSVQAGPMWLFRSDFPSCSESAACQLLFCEKALRFFPQVGKRGFKHVLESPPPPPSSNSIKDTRTVFWLSRIKILQYVVWRRTERGGGGGGLDFMQFCPYYVSASLKK